MAFRLLAYSGGQPPWIPNRAAIPDSESPGCTTYLLTGLVPDPASAAGEAAATGPAGAAGVADAADAAGAASAAGAVGTAVVLVLVLVLVRVLVLLLAVVLVVLYVVRVVAWAGRADPVRPAAARAASMRVQASTTHADVVHARIRLSLSFRRGISAGRCGPGTPKGGEPAGKE